MNCLLGCFLLLLCISATSCTANKDHKNEVEDSNARASSTGGIRWKNLSVSIKNKQANKPKLLLHPSTHHVENGSVCGVLGPSGAGKSTLLAALSSTTLKSAGLHVSGAVWMDEEVEDSADAGMPTSMDKAYLSTRNGEVAFLHQSDAFFSMLTPRETLDLAAYLQLSGCDAAERRRVVDNMLDSLGLSAVSDRSIGDRTMGGGDGGGLSGGERRRLSLAVELITSPRLFIGDEPTTGLASSQADKVVALIAKLAKERNIPAICSLHQPSSKLWKMLDSFILLGPGGNVCYMGNRSDASTYFEKLGYKCPQHTNPAEFYIDLVTVDTEDAAEAMKDLERIDHLAQAYAEQAELHHSSGLDSWTPPSDKRQTVFGLALIDNNGTKVGRRNFAQRFGALLRRAWRQNMRNHKLNLVRLAGSVGQALMFAELFKSVRVGKSISKSIADRVALLSFGVINMCMLSVMKTLDLFGREKPVVVRERMRSQYSALEYLLSKALAEIPIDALFGGAFAAILKTRTGLRTSLSVLTWTFSLLTVAGASMGFAIGSVAPDVESSMALGVPVMVILMAVGVINPSGVDANDPPPTIIKWLKSVSPIKWTIEALCITEFRGMEFAETEGKRWQALRDLPKMGGLALVKNGNQVLEALGLSQLTYEYVMGRLTSLAGVSLFLSWLGLTWFGPSFVESIGDDVVNTEKTNTTNTSSRIPTKVSDEDETKRLYSTSGTKMPLEVPLVR